MSDDARLGEEVGQISRMWEYIPERPELDLWCLFIIISTISVVDAYPNGWLSVVLTFGLCVGLFLPVLGWVRHG